jgi:hypothetical protein
MSEQPETVELVLQEDGIRAVNVLIAAVIVAQKAGAFSLQDAGSIADAIAVLVPPQEAELEDSPPEEEVA